MSPRRAWQFLEVGHERCAWCRLLPGGGTGRTGKPRVAENCPSGGGWLWGAQTGVYPGAEGSCLWMGGEGKANKKRERGNNHGNAGKRHKPPPSGFYLLASSVEVSYPLTAPRCPVGIYFLNYLFLPLLWVL